jgi:IS5 family transposase
MNQVVPWQRWLKIIEPYYPKKGKGRPPMSMENMLRIYCLQQWYALSDPSAEEALYDIESMRRFVKFELGEDPLPDETTILNFRRMMETHDLSEQLFKDVNNYLETQGIQVSQGSMVDATIIQSPSSTKNQEKKRDENMSSTRKGKQYYFGMKVHIGTDVNSKVVHSATVTSANEADINELPNLLREDDQVVFADAGYTSDSYKRGSRLLGMSWKVNDKRKPKKNLSVSQKKRNRQDSSIRARVEHIFRVMKCQFGYRKTRYKGLEKNRFQIFSLLSLTNLYLQRGHLMG